ncbi:MAG: ribulose-phosphate 3-epimerase [Candidatus Saccharimonadales bacterium]
MSSIICPTILAQDEVEYAAQIRRITPFAKRIQIDLMDGEFASPKSVSLDKIWWSHQLVADIHLMYQRPMEHLEQLVHLQPHMVIIHVEAMFHHMHFSAELHKEGIKTGLAILPDTPVANIEQIISSFDHLLIFSGHLGHFGGTADLGLLTKVQEAKEHHPDLEFGWDGGINAENAKQLAAGGIDVLNVGGAIQQADDPKSVYDHLITQIR